MTRKDRSCVICSAIEALESRRLYTMAPFGSETIVADTTGSRVEHDVAVAPNGEYIFATTIETRTELDDGEFVEAVTVNAIRYAADGRQIGQPLLLDTMDNLDDAVSSCSVAIAPSGDAVVAYMVKNQLTTTDQDPSVVKFVLISSDNVAAAPVVITPDHGLDITVAVSMDDSGGFFVAWSAQELQTPDAEYVRVRAFDAGGAARGPELTVETMSSSFEFFWSMDVASALDGSAAVVTYSFFDDRHSHATYARLSASAVVGSVVPVPEQDDTIFSDAVMYAGGAFNIAYEIQRSPDALAIVRRFDASGTQIGDAIDVRTLAPDPTASSRVLAIDKLVDGGFVTVLSQIRNQVQSLYVGRFESDGTSNPEGFALFERNKFATRLLEDVAAAVDDEGRLVVSYFTDQSTRYQRFTPNVYEIDHSTLYVTTGGRSDTVLIDDGDLAVTVTIGGTPQRTFPKPDVGSLYISTLGGNDRIEDRSRIPTTIRGGSGNDLIIGGDGNNLLRGHGGNDTIRGGLGEDFIIGDEGNDSILGNAGRDTIQAGDGNDTIRGHGGRDRISGDNGDDRIYGGASGDYLFGGGDADRLFGEDGDDALRGDTGIDSLYGGAGDDGLYSDDNAFDKIFGDTGTDYAEVDDIDRVRGAERVFVPI